MHATREREREREREKERERKRERERERERERDIVSFTVEMSLHHLSRIDGNIADDTT